MLQIKNLYGIYLFEIYDWSIVFTLSELLIGIDEQVAVNKEEGQLMDSMSANRDYCWVIHFYKLFEG